MKLSFRYDLRVPSTGAPSTDVYRGAIDQCAWADQHGLHAVYVGEHHGAEDGYIPSPIVFFGAVAQATTRLRMTLSAMVSVIHNPLRLAEDLAVLDIVSAGRSSVTLGMGYVPSEYPMFDVRREQRVALLSELIEVLRKAWTGEWFEYRGRRVRVTPRPATPSGPPVSVGATSEAAARRAARLGVLFDAPTPAVYEHYIAECAALGRQATPVQRRLDMQVVFVSDNPERDWPRVGPYVLAHHNGYAALQVDREKEQINFRHYDDVAQVVADPRYNVWTPAECLEHWADLGADDELVLQPLVGGMPPELSWESVRRLETEILPALHLDSATSPG